MAYTITSESYGPRLPKITATADSTADLATLGTNWAEGSTCVISTTTYVFDEVNGWAVAGSQGKELPDVTAEDNGDVLTVVDGAWGKAEPSGGGGGVLVATYTYDESTGTWSCDKTLSQILDAIASGVNVMAKLGDTLFAAKHYSVAPDDAPYSSVLFYNSEFTYDSTTSVSVGFYQIYHGSMSDPEEISFYGGYGEIAGQFTPDPKNTD